ncbi:MAG: hypothetical protein ACKPCM_15895 [Pseudanabaena sp.]
MARETRQGLPTNSNQTKIGRASSTETDIGKTTPEGSIEQSRRPIYLFITLGIFVATIFGGAYSLMNAPLIEPICRQIGNCQKFKEDSDKAQESFNKADKILKSKASLSELLAASKSIDEAKSALATIPDNTKELLPPIAEQRSKIAELDKKIAILLTLEESADKSLKEAIAKIASADQLDRNPQGKIEPPETAKSRLSKPKALYVEAQDLLKSIPDTSLLAKDKKERLKQVAEKIKDIDSKIGAVTAIDTCMVNPDSCKPIDPCVANPSACAAPPPNPCNVNPSACAEPPSNGGGTTKPPLFGRGSPGYGR